MNGVVDRFERQSDLVQRARLQDKLVTVIGVGAIGRQVALQLASIGVARLQLIDFDLVEATNVTTQGYRTDEIGTAKVMATISEIERIDRSIQLEYIIDRYRPKQDVGSIVFCCVDSIAARSAIWRSLRGRVDLWIDARMLGEIIRVLTAAEESDVSRYEATLFAPFEAQQGTCTSKSTIYTASIAAGLMVHQLTRWLREIPTDRDAIINLLSGEMTVNS